MMENDSRERTQSSRSASVRTKKGLSSRRQRPVDYVDPMIGTDETHFISQWRSEAGTYPGAVAPHGMVQMSPETSDDKDFLRGYYYWQDVIRRFSMTEHFSGWPNGSAGKGFMMPCALTSDGGEGASSNFESRFSHDNETAEAGYYSVYLSDSRIRCSFAAKTRSIIGRFAYERAGKYIVALSDFDTFELVSDREVALSCAAGRPDLGKSNAKIYLHLVFDREFEAATLDKKHILTFPSLAHDDNSLSFKYGGSYTSAVNAKHNLESEIPHWNFEGVKEDAKNLWDTELSRIEVEGGTEENKTIFHTAFYHS
ncbi:MAG: hypothetical protein GF344_08550, partial [Chitinivibrionales bacterium]|nr:hypothetical protein [Chitinivibrionales bacterium]MBD3356927.1 hypothetical protein [Chitinivibrionales bacterium]